MSARAPVKDCDHGADIGVRGLGATKAWSFEQARLSTRPST
jgi:hypothetical protein